MGLGRQTLVAPVYILPEGGGGGGGTSYVLDIRYVPLERPLFLTLNFCSGAYHFHKFMAEIFRSRASQFLVARQIFYIFAGPETTVFKISFCSSH